MKNSKFPINKKKEIIGLRNGNVFLAAACLIAGFRR